MNRRLVRSFGGLLAGGIVSALLYAATVPTFIEQPGTQPGQADLEPPDKCDNCHGGYDAATAPAFNWRGGMMSHALRDSIFRAAVAVAATGTVNLSWTGLRGIAALRAGRTGASGVSRTAG